MSKVYILLISLIIFVSYKTTSSDYCQKIQCNSEIGTDACIKVESTVSLMKPCPQSKMCDTSSEDPVIDSYCVDKKKSSFKRLPSLPCSSSEECISGNCNYKIQKCNGL